MLDVLSLPNFKYDVKHYVITDRQYQELVRREHNKHRPKHLQLAMNPALPRHLHE